MSIFKTATDLMTIPGILAALSSAFNRFDKIDEDEEWATFRLSHDNLGLIYENDDEAKVEIKIIPTSLVPSKTEKCMIKVTAINGVGLENINYSPKPNPCVTYEHTSKGSSQGVKSKG